jgi:gamma-D-glutamyl-L-lysine dipeptidyl-peptidase
MARKFVIEIPIADLRGEPKAIEAKDYSHQALRESQLLFGEQVELIEQRGEWLKIAALEQPYFDENKGWHPYLGWIHQSEAREVERFVPPTHVVSTPTTSFEGHTLSYGTLLAGECAAHPHLRPLPKKLNREILVEEAKHFLGIPYLWGGRAYHLDSHPSSVDCSGLINLLYRAQGILLPRNAYDQYLKCKPTFNLKPGDPLYLAKESRVNHVLLKLDENHFIESPRTKEHVRLLTWGEHIWEKGGKIHIFDSPHSFTPYPGTFTF